VTRSARCSLSCPAGAQAHGRGWSAAQPVDRMCAESSSRPAGAGETSRPGTLTQLLYHVVFSTKHRANLIAPELQARLYDYLGGIVRGERGRKVTRRSL